MLGSEKEGGFSLLEVVIAMAVLSIGLLAFIGMFGAGYQALKSGDNRTIAAQLARNQMETLRATAPSESNGEANLPKGMIGTWSIQQDEDDPGIWIISVEVCWNDCEGERKRAVFLKGFRAS